MATGAVTVANSPGGVIDHLFRLGDRIQVAGGSPRAVRTGHRGTTDQEEVAVDSLSFELVQQRDDILPGQHRLRHSPMTGGEKHAAIG